jgi:hypothetical protein
VLWTGLGRSKARKPGYNQAGKYKTKQNKTRQNNTGGLGALLIHQLVLVCWRVVPQTISFYNPEPSYTRSFLMAYTQRCRDMAALSRRGCTFKMWLHYCTAETWLHWCTTEMWLHYRDVVALLHCRNVAVVSRLIYLIFTLSDLGHDNVFPSSLIDSNVSLK